MPQDKYDEMKLQTNRKNLEVKMSSLYGKAFKKIWCSKEELMLGVNDLVSSFNTILSDENHENIQKMLGGEFNKDITYLGGDFFPEKSSMPLYLYLDLIIIAIERNYLKNNIQNDDLIELLRNLKQIREKATKLKFDEKFIPEEEYDDYLIDKIIGVKGNIEFLMDKKEGIKHLAVECIYLADNGVLKNGDFYSSDPAVTYHRHSPQPLYKKDSEAIRDVKFEKTKINLERLKTIAQKYFIDGKIPSAYNFHVNLKDSELDKRLRITLFSICSEKAFNDYDRADKVVYEMDELDKIEQLIEQERIQKEIEERQRKESAIHSAKERYNSKNFLWKFMNRKISPQKQSFDDMTVEELNQLYVGRRK